MNKSLNLIVPSCLLIALLVSGCNLSQSAAPNNLNAAAANVKPTVAPNANAAAPNENSTPAVNAAKSDDADAGDIKTCSPEKLYRGEILTVRLKQPHGNYAAIRRMTDDKWFFLNNAERSAPVWNRAEFKMLSEIKINPETAVNTTNSETAEKIFNRSGKYRIMVSDQDFGQDDPPVTGICEIEYVHQKRLK